MGASWLIQAWINWIAGWIAGVIEAIPWQIALKRTVTWDTSLHHCVCVCVCVCRCRYATCPDATSCIVKVFPGCINGSSSDVRRKSHSTTSNIRCSDSGKQPCMLVSRHRPILCNVHRHHASIESKLCWATKLKCCKIQTIHVDAVPLGSNSLSSGATEP